MPVPCASSVPSRFCAVASPPGRRADLLQFGRCDRVAAAIGRELRRRLPGRFRVTVGQATPFSGRREVARDIGALFVERGQHPPRALVAAFRGRGEPADGSLRIALHAPAVHQRGFLRIDLAVDDQVAILVVLVAHRRPGRALRRGGDTCPSPALGLRGILRHADAALVEMGEQLLRARVAGFRGPLQPARRDRRVLRYAPAVQVHPAQRSLRGGVALFGRWSELAERVRIVAALQCGEPLASAGGRAGAPACCQAGNRDAGRKRCRLAQPRPRAARFVHAPQATPRRAPPIDARQRSMTAPRAAVPGRCRRRRAPGG